MVENYFDYLRNKLVKLCISVFWVFLNYIAPQHMFPFFFLGRKALDYALHEGHNEIKRIFEKAPTRASWDLQNDIGMCFHNVLLM